MAAVTISTDLIEALPLIKAYKDSFEAQNKRLSRTTLTGKISSLHDAATLFEFMETTRKNFAELQEQLVGYLLDENINKSVADALRHATAAIDMLTRNLYERSADVGFLSADSTIISYLTGEASAAADNEIHSHLAAYASYYTVYSEIVLLRTNGVVAASLNGANGAARTQDSFVDHALKTDEFVQSYAISDLTGKSSLIFAHRICSLDTPIGVLALVFDLQDEMTRIFESVGGTLAFVDGKSRVVGSTLPKLAGETIHQNPKNQYMLRKLGRRSFLSVSAPSKGYEGYKGLDWSAFGFSKLSNNEKKEGAQSDKKLSVLLPTKLREIVSRSEEISEDLGDVVINGELIASKTRAYALNPILENIRAIGEQTRAIFVQTESDLVQTVSQSLFDESQLLTRIALNIMDRNLYERANDCRWWANARVFKEANWDAAAKTLEYINSLYTVYSLLFVFDENGVIRAVSKHDGLRFVGQKCSDQTHLSALANRNNQAYFVSPFAASGYYGDKPTYTYYATILGGAGVVGGVGIVFDAAAQFDSILRAALPVGRDGAFNLFFDDKKQVIGSTSARFKPLEPLPFDINEFKTTMLYDWEDKEYIVALSQAQGYREYKSKESKIYSLLFVPAV